MRDGGQITQGGNEHVVDNNLMVGHYRLAGQADLMARRWELLHGLWILHQPTYVRWGGIARSSSTASSTQPRQATPVLAAAGAGDAH